MKSIKILTLAAVALLFGLTSCNNNDSNEAPTGEDFRVSLSFVKDGTYADGAAATGGTKVTIEDGYLLFANAAEMITDVYTITTGATSGKNIKASELGTTPVVLDKVSGASMKVYMLANKGTLAAVPVIGGNATTFMTSAMKVEDQVDYTKVTSTGNATLATVAGKPDERTAAITLATSVSRIQITDVAFASNFTAGTLEGIFINNYYPTMELNGTAIGNLIGSTDKADYISPDSPIFTNNLLTHVFDYGIAGPIATPIKPTKDVWGYNLFTSATPQIILKLTGVVVGGQTLGEQYVTINGFSNGSTDITTLAGGMIYTIGAGSLVVDFGDLSPVPGMRAIKVDVTVTTVTWAETTVTPNL